MKKRLIFIKNYICVLLVLISMFSCICFNGLIARADAELSEDDLNIIKSIIYDLAEQDNYNVDESSYRVNDLYYSNESWAGYVIDFVHSKEKKGFAIVFLIDNIYKLIQANFEQSSPYLDKDGIYIYPSLGYYILKVGDEYFDAITMNKIEDYIPNNNLEFYAANNSDKGKTEVTRKITYKRGNIFRKEIPDFYCSYSTSLTSETHSNNCANAAGVIMLNYWNKYYNNDLLKLEPSQMKNGNMDEETAKTYMKIFYDYMNTNWFLGVGGTLPDNCYDGFERLIKEKRYSVTRDNKWAYNDIFLNIKKKIPVFITSTDYYFKKNSQDVLDDPNQQYGNNELIIDYIRRNGIESSHTFVAYGYAYYFLYDSQENMFYEEFLKVANGWGGKCYFNYTMSTLLSTAAINVFKE